MLPPEIANAAYDAGIHNVTDLATAVAIALAESGGNEGARAGEKYGLWMIDMAGATGANRRAQFGLADNAALFAPATSARVMAGLSAGGKSWGMWKTYQGLRYAAAYPVALAAATGIMTAKGAIKAGGDAADAITAPLDAASSAVDLAQKAGAWMSKRDNWFRVAKVGGGLALIVGGIIVAARPIMKSAAATVVQTALPIGKAGKALGAVGGSK